MALQTWVARFVVDQGRVTEEGGLLRTFQRRRLDEPDVDLHILAEPEGAKGDELGAQALDAIGRLFLQDRLSLSGGLLRALGSTNQTLLDWNRRSLPREQVSAGITAAVVSGPVVYLAQAGPSLAFLRRGGPSALRPGSGQAGSGRSALRRLVPEDAALTPLGGGDLAPVLRRIDLAAGDIVLAASPALESVLDAGTLEALLSRGSDEALPELYLMTRDLPRFALFLVTATEQAEAEPAPEAAPAPPEPAGAATEAPEPATAGPAMPPPVDISRPVVRLRSEQAIGRAEYPRTTGLARPFHVNLTDWRLLRYALAVAVALLVIAFVPDLVRQGRSEKLENLVQGAQTSLTAALATNDPARRRELLEDTRRFANEALRIDPEAITAEQLLQEASANLSTMDAIFDLGPMTTVTTLGRQITGEVSVEAVVVAGGSAYLLDVKGGRIISVPLAAAGPPAVVYQEGVAYGGMPAKEPLYVAWDATGAGRLLVLDAERKLFALRPASLPEPLALRRTNTWASIGGIAAYDGNLYVLDPKGNQVHRYLPAASGFDSEPSAVLSAGELGSAQGLAVDGDIYVYFKDGSVRRFRGGEDVGFGLGGIDRLPERAVDLALLSAADEVYIADSGNKRVVVAGTDGTFRRQLVSNAFTDLRAIAVDAAGGQLYVVVGDALLTAALVR